MRQFNEKNIIQQISTHCAIINKDKIEIWVKGLVIEADFPDDKRMEFKPEYMYSIPNDEEDDLLDIFERLQENNRCNLAEANAEFGL